MSLCVRVRTCLGLGIALAALVAVQVPMAHAHGQPISVSGFNADVIIDKDTTTRQSQSYDGGPVAWFEVGAVDDTGAENDDGVPAGQAVASANGSGVVYQLQPAN